MSSILPQDPDSKTPPPDWLTPAAEAARVTEGLCEVCGDHSAVVTAVFIHTAPMATRYCAAPACREDLATSLRAFDGDA